MGKAGEEDRRRDEADPDSQQKPADHEAGFLGQLTSRLNYLCVEHWLTSAVFILALGFIGFAVQSRFSTVTPTRWGIFGAMIVAAYVILAALHLILKRPRCPIVTTAVGQPLPASAEPQPQERDSWERAADIPALIDVIHAHMRWLDLCLRTGDKPHARAEIYAIYATGAARRLGVESPQPLPESGARITEDLAWYQALVGAATRRFGQRRR